MEKNLKKGQIVYTLFDGFAIRPAIILEDVEDGLCTVKILPGKYLTDHSTEYVYVVDRVVAGISISWLYESVDACRLGIPVAVSDY